MIEFWWGIDTPVVAAGALVVWDGGAVAVVIYFYFLGKKIKNGRIVF